MFETLKCITDSHVKTALNMAKNIEIYATQATESDPIMMMASISDPASLCHAYTMSQN